ncbi:hypothetical protein Tco_0661592, partial [Tanacetum coccineum]
SIPEGSGGNHGGQSSSDRSQSGTEDDQHCKEFYDFTEPISFWWMDTMIWGISSHVSENKIYWGYYSDK